MTLANPKVIPSLSVGDTLALGAVVAAVPSAVLLVYPVSADHGRRALSRGTVGTVARRG